MTSGVSAENCWTSEGKEGYENLYSQNTDVYTSDSNIEQMCVNMGQDGAAAASLCGEEGSSACSYDIVGLDKSLENKFLSDSVFIIYEEENKLRNKGITKEDAKSYISDLFYCRSEGYSTLRQCKNNFELDGVSSYGHFISSTDFIAEEIRNERSQNEQNVDDDSTTSSGSTSKTVDWSIVNANPSSANNPETVEFTVKAQSDGLNLGNGGRRLLLERSSNSYASIGIDDVGSVTCNGASDTCSITKSGVSVNEGDVFYGNLQGEGNYEETFVWPDDFGVDVSYDDQSSDTDYEYVDDGSTDTTEEDSEYSGECSNPPDGIGEFSNAEDGYPRGSKYISGGGCVYWAWTKHPGDGKDTTFRFVDENTGSGETMNMKFQFQIESEDLDLSTGRWDLRGLRKRTDLIWKNSRGYREFSAYKNCKGGGKDRCVLNNGEPATISGGSGDYKVRVNIYDTNPDLIDGSRIEPKTYFEPITFTAE